MPFVPVPNVAQVEIRELIGGQKVENTLYFRFAGPIIEGNLETLGAQLESWWLDEISAKKCQVVSLREIYLTDLTTESSEAVTHIPTGTPTGSVAETPVPNNVAVCISFRTAKRGRSYRGRNYFMGFTRLGVNDNRISSGFADSIQDAYNDLLADTHVTVATWGVVSRYHNNAPRVTGEFTPITAAIITDLVVDSQRRRLPGRGE